MRVLGRVTARLTLHLLQHAIDGARAARAGHRDVEVVVVVRHGFI